jgi:hypothetical protein
MLQRFKGFYGNRNSNRLISTLSPAIPAMVQDCPELARLAPAERWRVEKIFPSLSDMTVMVIGTGDDLASAILYLPRSDRAIADFERRKKVMVEFYEDGRLQDLYPYLPHLLGEGTFQHQPYWISARLPGVSANSILHGNQRMAVLRLAIQVLGLLHWPTARKIVVGSEQLERWVYMPLRILLKSPLVFYHRKSRLLLERLETRLAKELGGQYVTISWVHGDFWPNNILVSLDPIRISGIVDWDLARPDDLPTLDLVNLLLSACREIQGTELGQVIVETHKRGRWENDIQELWDFGIQSMEIDQPCLQDALLLFWIRHLSANLEKSRLYSVSPVWALKNYQFIMNYLENDLID